MKQSHNYLILVQYDQTVYESKAFYVKNVDFDINFAFYTIYLQGIQPKVVSISLYKQVKQSYKHLETLTNKERDEITRLYKTYNSTIPYNPFPSK